MNVLARRLVRNRFPISSQVMGMDFVKQTTGKPTRYAAVQCGTAAWYSQSAIASSSSMSTTWEDNTITDTTPQPTTTKGTTSFSIDQLLLSNRTQVGTQNTSSKLNNQTKGEAFFDFPKPFQSLSPDAIIRDVNKVLDIVWAKQTALNVFKEGGASDDDLKILEQLDSFCLFLVSEARKLVNEIPIHGCDIRMEFVDLGWKKIDEYAKNSQDNYIPNPEDLQMAELGIADEMELPILQQDDFFGEVGDPFAIFRSSLLFPLEDRSVVVDDERALEIAQAVRLSPRSDDEPHASPKPYHTWSDGMSTDDALTRMFFYGVASTTVKEAATDEHKALGPFVADMDLSDLPVREGFKSYGSRLHFDENQNITAIYDYESKTLVKPTTTDDNGDAASKWEEAKFTARVTAFTLVTAREHLVHAHMICSNTVARCKTVHLNPLHPLRRLLTIFTYRTNFINNVAVGTLTPTLGGLHRASAFTASGLSQVFATNVKECSIFQPFPEQEFGNELEKLANEGKFPYRSEGLAYYKIVEEFVTEWIAHAGTEQVFDEQGKAFYQDIVNSTENLAYQVPAEFNEKNLIAVLTQFIFTVTCFHEMVGTIVDYTEKPSYAGYRTLSSSSKSANQKNGDDGHENHDNQENVVDLQSYLSAAVITASTGVQMPALVDRFENFFGIGEGVPQWERPVWDAFQEQLHVQSKKVQKADKARRFECKTFDPAHFECSISV